MSRPKILSSIMFSSVADHICILGVFSFSQNGITSCDNLLSVGSTKDPVVNTMYTGHVGSTELC